jgi:hypothetical protein
MVKPGACHANKDGAPLWHTKALYCVEAINSVSVSGRRSRQ